MQQQTDRSSSEPSPLLGYEHLDVEIAPPRRPWHLFAAIVIGWIPVVLLLPLMVTEARSLNLSDPHAVISAVLWAAVGCAAAVFVAVLFYRAVVRASRKEAEIISILAISAAIPATLLAAPALVSLNSRPLQHWEQYRPVAAAAACWFVAWSMWSWSRQLTRKRARGSADSEV